MKLVVMPVLREGSIFAPNYKKNDQNEETVYAYDVREASIFISHPILSLNGSLGTAGRKFWRIPEAGQS